MRPDPIELVAIRSTVAPFANVSVSEPAPDSAGLLFHSELALSVPCPLKDNSGGLGADELKAGCRVDRRLVRAVRDDPDVHQLREIVDGVVALIHQRCGSVVVRRKALQLRIEFRDLRQVVIGLNDRSPDVLLRVRTQRLNSLRRGIQLLRQRLRGRQGQGSRGRGARIRRQRLQRRGEIVVCGLERSGAARRPIEALQLAQHI